MAEYIERQAAIDAIDCDITITGRQNAELVAATIGTFADRIKALPSASVVPVVRCKDCEYSMKWRPEESAKKFGQVYECVRGVFTCPDANDFCSHGERRKGRTE